MGTQIKYMDKGWLIRANDYAKKKKWKKTIPSEVLSTLPDNKIIPICFMVPEDDEKMVITLTVYANLKKKKAVNYDLHIPLALFEKLPEVEAPDIEHEDSDDNTGDGMGSGAKEFLGL